MVASTGTLGFGLSFLEVFLTGAFGLKVTFMATWCLMPVSCGIMAVGALYHDFIREWPIVIYVVHLIAVTSSSVGSLATFRATVDLCDKRHVGKVIGVYYASYALGKIFYASLVDFFFGHNLAGFFFTLALIFLVFIGIVYAVLYKSTALRSEGYGKLAQDVPLDAPKDVPLENVDAGVTPTISVIKSAFFHATFWPSVILLSASFAIVNNLTAIAAAVGIRDPIVPVYCVTIVLVVTRGALTLLLDIFPSHMVGFFLLTAGSLCLAVDMLVGMIWLNAATLFAMVALTGIAGAPSLIIAVSILVNRFGKPHSAAVVGSFYFLYSVIQTIFQLAMGYIYDDQIQQNGRPDNKWCYGLGCFYLSFCMLFIVSVCISLVQAINCILSICSDQNQ